MKEVHDRVTLNMKLFTPLDRFQLINRMTFEWTSLLSVIHDTHNYAATLIDSLDHFTKHAAQLDPENKFYGAKTILETQETYNLQAGHLANGVVDHTATETRLTASNCYDLGYVALQLNKRNISTDWIREVFPRLDRQPQNIKFFKKQIENVIINSYETGDRKTAKEFTQILSEMDDDFKVNDLESLLRRLNATMGWLNENNALKGYDLFDPDVVEEGEETDSDAVTNNEDHIHLYRSLCNGNYKFDRTLIGLCLTSSPLGGDRTWGHFNEEIIHTDPLVMQLHDLLTAEESFGLISQTKDLVGSWSIFIEF